MYEKIVKNISEDFNFENILTRCDNVYHSFICKVRKIQTYVNIYLYFPKKIDIVLYLYKQFIC